MGFVVGGNGGTGEGGERSQSSLHEEASQDDPGDANSRGPRYSIGPGTRATMMGQCFA